MRSRSKSAMLLAAVLLAGGAGWAAQVKPTWSADEQPVADQVRGLRQVADDARGGLTRELAVRIRRLPATPNKVRLAEGLASMATEGDFGQATLQEVATTLAEALREQPVASENGEPGMPYVTLAELVRYEQVQVSLDARPLAAAFAKLEAAERRRASAEIDLRDLSGKEWKLSDLRGKVVLVNFWATWCPPCRKEIPDLGVLYARFQERGFAILAISDEEAGKVAAFAKEQNIKYPILLDTGRRVHDLFGVEGIPKSFVYDRDGKIVATAIDMRTQQQFLGMLAKAGLD
ncbi:MAG: peroxiredoxin family protein [Bryobacteraceae bacterium]